MRGANLTAGQAGKLPARAAAATHFNLRPDWLSSMREEIIEPDLPIIDPHHHLWDRDWRYLLDELIGDVGSGHNIRSTVYVQATSMYRASAPSEWQSLGETEFANGVAAMSASGAYGEFRACAGIVGYVDLMLGDRAALVLDRHIEAAGSRLKGIRNSSVWDPDPSIVTTRRQPPRGLLADRSFREGFALLEARRLSFDAWLYHPQISELRDLARAFPGATIILDHVGAPLGVGSYANRRAEVFSHWRRDMQALAECPNVNVKLGGLGMPVMGFGFETMAVAPSSEILAEAWRPYFDLCIEVFGTRRCMFESNFPVDKQACSYGIVWNAFKRCASGLSASEKADLFHDTAARVYRLDEPDPRASSLRGSCE